MDKEAQLIMARNCEGLFHYREQMKIRAKRRNGVVVSVNGLDTRKPFDKNFPHRLEQAAKRQRAWWDKNYK